MTPSVFIDTELKSTALDAIVLCPTKRTVQFAWASGSVSAHHLRLRDIVRFYIRHIMMDPELSYGVWANFVLDNQL